LHIGGQKVTTWQRELLERLGKMRKHLEQMDGKDREALKTQISELQIQIRRLGEREVSLVNRAKKDGSF
jgi:hypothetical protein